MKAFFFCSGYEKCIKVAKRLYTARENEQKIYTKDDAEKRRKRISSARSAEHKKR